MKGVLRALAISLAVHCLVGAAIVLAISAAKPVELPRLDLSAVELSLSEEEEETAPPAPAAEPDPPPSEPEPHPDSRPPSRVPEPEPQNPSPPSPPAPAVAPKQARVEAPPRLLKTIRPDYPKGPRQRGEEGDVGLEFSITPRGTVDSVTVYSSSGYAELDAAAVRAAKKARFSPAMEGRRAVSATARLVVSFRLKDR